MFLFPPKQYHALLVRLIDCLPNLTSEFRAEFSDTTLSEGETTALLHFMAPAADIFIRLAFASDPLNLTFASPQLNRDQKIAKDVAEWLPDLNRCWFVNRVVAVKRRYGLSMDPREAQAALAFLTTCPSFAMQITAPASAETTTPPKPTRTQPPKPKAIPWTSTTTTTTAASPAPKPAATTSPPSAATTPPIPTCATQTEMAWCVSRYV